MSTYIIVKDELSHYGVKGMRWGVRKQQPSIGGRLHGLASNNSLRKSKASGARKVANYNNSLTPLQKEQRRAQRRARAKKAAIIGGAVVGTALAVYGAKKLHDKQVLKLANAMAERGYGKGPNYFKSYKDARRNWAEDGFKGYKRMISDISDYRDGSGFLSQRELNKMGIKTFEPERLDLGIRDINRVADAYQRKKNTLII